MRKLLWAAIGGVVWRWFQKRSYRRLPRRY